MLELGRVESKDINEFNIQSEDNTVKNEDIVTRLSSVTNAWAYMPTFVSIASLANFLARHTLGSCQNLNLVDNEKIFFDSCVLPYERTLFWGGISIALFTTSLALPYLPSVIDRIKKMRIIGEDVKESRASKKPVRFDKLDPTSTLSIGLVLVGVMKSLGSLVYFSEAGIRTVFGACTPESIYNGNNVTYHVTNFSCQDALQNGYTEILAAGILFATATIISNSPALIGRIKKIFNK